jgi:hypothetical protein
MEYCGPRGISHSHFLGGPPVWTQADRDYALWWSIQQREKCQSCGIDPKKLEEDPNAYTWKVESCPGCELREKGQKVALQQVRRKDPKATALPPWQWVTLVRNRKASR